MYDVLTGNNRSEARCHDRHCSRATESLYRLEIAFGICPWAPCSYLVSYLRGLGSIPRLFGTEFKPVYEIEVHPRLFGSGSNA